MKRRTIERCRRRLRLQGALMGIVVGLLLPAFPADAQTDTLLPAIGGRGGSQFVARCPEGQLLTGFELVTGNDVDSIQPICAIAHGPAEIGPREQLTQALPYLSRHPLLCPSNAPIVIGMRIKSEGRTEVVNAIHLWCGIAAASQNLTANPNAIFEGPTLGTRTDTTEFCEAGQVAVGVHGKSGVWLDSAGLICGPPTVTTKPLPGKALGRVRVPASGAPPPPRSICQAARDARARNSPAAPGLEAQCRAAGAAGEIPPAPPPVISSVPPPRSVCEDAFEARARNSTTAVYLEEQCRAFAEELRLLRERGDALANEDPLASELRDRQPADSRGFDIGLGAAEGHTAHGPGKDRIRDSLAPDERRAFNRAVEYSLERNRNAEFAAHGAAIVAADPTVAEARNVDPDVFYRLGFNIATGIFGDPALGAKGNTAIGPGSLKIRDSLSAAGQRGFNAAVALHLSRNYKP